MSGIFSFFTNLFGDNSSSSSFDSSSHFTDINPANGLPMIENSGIDVAGNAYGTDSSHSMFDHTSSCDSSFDNSWSSSSGSDDSWSSSGIDDSWSSSGNSWD